MTQQERIRRLLGREPQDAYEVIVPEQPAAQYDIPPSPVSSTTTVTDPRLARADELERQAQPPARQGGLVPQILKSALEGIASSNMPGGYMAYRQQQDQNERQRQQDLLSRVNQLRSQSADAEQLGMQRRTLALNEQKAAGDIDEQLARVNLLRNPKPEFSSSPEGIYRKDTGEVTTPAAVRPPTPQAPRNIDPNSPEGIEARLKFERGKTAMMDTDTAVDMSTEALDMAARRYLQDGTLPPMGMGAKASGARSRILNRASQIDPQASVAANAAEFKANQAALTQLQKSSDAVNAFESTAKKNLAQFIATARKVRDSGSPWINRGLRSVDRNLLGSADQTAYDAARQVAFTEIARVVSNPNLVGQLSDNARQEMETILTGDATLAQTLKAAETLTQDMDNRKGSIEGQIQSIKGRLQSPSTQSPASSGTEEWERGPDGKLRRKNAQ